MVAQLDKDPAPATINTSVNTGSGAYVSGNVSVSDGGMFVGRDGVRQQKLIGMWACNHKGIAND
jgi:hypothetical protein